MMDIIKLIGSVTEKVGMTPACLIALVSIFVFYRLLVQKDLVIGKQTDAVKANTVVLAEIKTLLTAFLPGRN